LVFEHAGRVYWADWKSDYLPRYTTATVGHHVEAHYDTQAQLYTLGMVRLLGITDEAAYEERFGGLLYVFLRGFAHGAVGEGLYFARPAWSTVCADELRLEANIPGWGAK
jgi:exodeoxyribonuclease V beta subunit